MGFPFYWWDPASPSGLNRSRTNLFPVAPGTVFCLLPLQGSLPSGTKGALLAGVWPTVMTSSNDAELDLWLGARLARYFMFLNGDILNTSETLNASCATFRKM